MKTIRTWIELRKLHQCFDNGDRAKMEEMLEMARSVVARLELELATSDD